MLIQNLNSIGLILDMVGVLLLWKYGIPNKTLAPKDMLHSVWVDEVPEVSKGVHNRSRLIRLLFDHLGYVLLFLGFAAQLASNYVPKAPCVTIVVASLEPRTLGAAMKEISGTLRTIIQGPGSSSAVAA